MFCRVEYYSFRLDPPKKHLFYSLPIVIYDMAIGEDCIENIILIGAPMVMLHHLFIFL
jgi:hypothetical protein